MNLIGLDISKVSTGLAIEVKGKNYLFSYNTMKITSKWNKVLNTIDDIKIRTYEYDNSIFSLLVGPKENLWVQTLDKHGKLFDVINKKGKIIEQYRIKDKHFGSCKFYNNKLYEIKIKNKGKDDEEMILNVYKFNK